MTKLQQQYNQNKQAFKDLGKLFPVSLEQVKELLTKEQKTAISKGKGQLVVCPEINKDFTFLDLTKKYPYDIWVYEALWEQYDLSAPASINVIDLTAGNENGDSVVQHTDKTLDAQRQIKGEFINPQEALILNTILKQDGQDLAPKTWMRFPQLSNKTVGGDSIVGVVRSDGGWLRFGWVSGGRADPSGGVGLSVGQRINLNPSTSSLPSSSSSDLLIGYLLDKGHSVNKKLIQDIEEYYQ